jgi:hypothetical protein
MVSENDLETAKGLLENLEQKAPAEDDSSSGQS